MRPVYDEKVCIVHEDVSRILFSEQDLSNRVAEMGAAITRDYADATREEGLILISVLRGAAIFMADLAREIKLPLEMDYMAISSYGSGVKSSGVVRILKDLDAKIEGRDVLIVEDILDSGITLSYLIKMLESRNPKSVKVAAFLVKDVEGKKPAVHPEYVGTHVPDAFIVGYGLDYAERYRNLPYIGVLKPEVYS